MSNEVFPVPNGVRVLDVGQGSFCSVRYVVCKDVYNISSGVVPPVRAGEVSRVVFSDGVDSTVVRFKAFVVVTDVFRLFNYSSSSVSAAASAAAKKLGLAVISAEVGGHPTNVMSVRNAIRLANAAKTSTKADVLKYGSLREAATAAFTYIGLFGENFE